MNYWLHPEAEAELGGPQIYAVEHQSRKPAYWNERTD